MNKFYKNNLSSLLTISSGEIQTLLEEMGKDDLESGYTREITAVMEDLELAPKRRSVI